MNKVYNILLDNLKIGTTRLEKADPAMGVVFGEIEFLTIDSGYDFFKDYCKKNKIEFTDYTDDRLISTRTIPNLEVMDENGNEIKGLGCYISGMDAEGFEVHVEGIPYPFYGDEFPHHVKAYEERF